MKAKEIEQKIWDFFGGKSAAMAAISKMTPEDAERLKAGIAADLGGKSAMEAAGMKKPASEGVTPADLNGGTMYTPVAGAKTYTPEEEAALAATVDSYNLPYFQRKADENRADLETSKSEINRFRGYATDTYATDLAKNNRSFAMQMRQAANAYGARGLSGSGIFEGYATDQALGQQETQAGLKTGLDRTLEGYLSKQKEAQTSADRALQDIGRAQKTQNLTDIQKIKDSQAQAEYNRLLLADRAPKLNGGTFNAAASAFNK